MVTTWNVEAYDRYDREGDEYVYVREEEDDDDRREDDGVESDELERER